MLLIYNLLVELAIALLRIISPLSSKIKFLIVGHRKTLKKLINFNINLYDKRLWFHCASLGEFEQCKPLIQKIKSKHPESKIIISFFSPSGYEISKNYKFADLVCYLPFDTLKNVKFFLNKVKPTIVFFIKYEFWPNYINQITKNKIPIFSLCTRLYADQFIFKPYSNWLLKIIREINHFFVQDISSQKLLNKNKFKNVTLVGDIRMDRVIENIESINVFPKIEKFIDSKKCFIAGSTWSEDYEVILSKIKRLNNVKVIIAPHKIDLKSINLLTSRLNNSYTLYSSLKTTEEFKKDVLIINSIGILSKIYKYANLSYVGGGMGKDGLHNILEPAIHGSPIIIGKNYSKFSEAKDLISLGGITSIKNNNEFEKVFEKIISDNELSKKIGKINKEYIFNNKGATNKIYSKLIDYL